MALGAVLLVSGCEQNEAAARDDATCKGQGLAIGTPAYVQCRQQLAHARGSQFKNFTIGGFDQTMINGCNAGINVCSPDGVRGLPSP